MAQSLSKKQEKITSRESSGPSNPPERNFSEVRAGLLVLAAFATLTGLLLWSGDSAVFRQTRDVRVYFNYISGLSKNAPVQLAGHKIGKVKNIEFLGTPDAMIAVTLTVDGKAPVRKDSAAYIDTLGLMGEKYVELTAGTPGTALLETQETLKGTDPLPMMELLKRGTEIAEQFERTADSMDGLLKDLHTLVGENQDELSTIFKNLNASSANLKDMTEDLKKHPWKLLRKTDDEKKKKKRLLII